MEYRYQSQLTKGMTELEVISLFGTPEYILKANEITGLEPEAQKAFYYELPIGNAFDSKYFVVVFNNDGKYIYSLVFEN